MGRATGWATGTGDLLRAGSRHRSLLAAGLAAAAVATALPVLAPSPPETVQVVAAARDLASGRPLTTDDLRLLALPVGALPDGALTSLGGALGRSLAGTVRRGETLTDVRLLGAGLVRGRGVVAVPVRLADPATAALLHPGDRVDVLGVPVETRADPTVAVTATTVAAGLEVLSVPAADRTDADGALVVLGASPATAALLAAAAVTSRLSVAVLGS